tara:strand:+ start:878 stop:1075 length:198 start_codon:yes stop_codon:yes gene_type:complete
MIGADITKNTFQLHGADSTGNPVMKQRLPRHKLAAYGAQNRLLPIQWQGCRRAQYQAKGLQCHGG